MDSDQIAGKTVKKRQSFMRSFYHWLSHLLKESWESMLMRLANIVPLSHADRSTELKNLLLRQAGLRIACPVFIDHGFRCIQPENIVIERCVSLGHDNHIWAFTPVRIGHHTITAKDLLVIAGSHDVSTFEPLAGQEVEIGPGCWIGARVTIMGGVKIGKGCVIGAGSLVRTSIPDWCIAAGVPARVIKQRQPAEMIWNHFGNYSVKELD
jgi:acetyltransferase-like isoleucine patch superfamily enzyme